MNSGLTKRAILTLALTAVICIAASAVWAEIPDTAKVHFNAGVEATQGNKIDEAITQYEAAIKLSPEYRDAHINVGALYFQKDNMAKASEHLEAAFCLAQPSVGQVVPTQVVGGQDALQE